MEKISDRYIDKKIREMLETAPGGCKFLGSDLLKMVGLNPDSKHGSKVGKMIFKYCVDYGKLIRIEHGMDVDLLKQTSYENYVKHETRL